MASDPDNRWLGRQRGRRLTIEEFRDAVLDRCGQLNRELGGPSQAWFGPPMKSAKRSLYGYIDRLNLHNELRMFDFPNPDLHISTRSETTVPQQALFGLNHPFLAGIAQDLIARMPERMDGSSQVDWLYRRLLQRAPCETEKLAAVDFLRSADSASSAPQKTHAQQWEYLYGGLDVARKSLVEPKPIPHFNGTAWQGGSRWPDDKLGWVQLTPQGGHPGNDAAHAVVRRWRAPRSMTIGIDSMAEHEPNQGNGIVCHVLIESQGILHSEPLHHQKKKLELPRVSLMAGECVDFICDVAGQLGYDQFLWAIDIVEVTDRPSPERWNSATDFRMVQDVLSPVAQLAQVLLLSNEFVYLD
jgi:hypothetical protein